MADGVWMEFEALMNLGLGFFLFLFRTIWCIFPGIRYTACLDGMFDDDMFSLMRKSFHRGYGLAFWY